MPTRATTNIKRRLYQVAYRATEAFAVPADAAEWATLLATFDPIGYVRRSSIDGSQEKGDVEELDDASELVLGYNQTVKFVALQTEDIDITEYEGLQGDALDIMFYNVTAQRAIVYPNCICNVTDIIKGGETDAFSFELTKKNAASITALRTHFDIPQA